MEYARVPDLALETNTYPRIDVIDDPLATLELQIRSIVVLLCDCGLVEGDF